MPDWYHFQLNLYFSSSICQLCLFCYLLSPCKKVGARKKERKENDNSVVFSKCRHSIYWTSNQYSAINSGLYNNEYGYKFYFFLAFLNVLNIIKYKIPYFFPIPSTKRFIRAIYQQPSIFFVSLNIKFYPALPVY